ncbi:hypothetical protein MOMA_02235 [Moraxella macacae 0408225]|uniref:Transglutaminase-like domain-containing protein n=1 Tax=Moraxella macacae 0408225 TaxID=1230338 RepID=L2F8V7_9GAMM|nr:transglutaminase-like domain-containing protein [Moraxella macacae]ELA09186.1 hypothetical protein MOMA_02235 [Moraxella macacae 0408225]
MSLFYKIDKPKPDNQTLDYKPTVLTKAVSVLCTITLINALLLPAMAMAQNHHNQQKDIEAQAVAGQNAYEQLVNLTHQYHLQTQTHQAEHKNYLKGRSIYRKLIDGITDLFTNNNENIDLYNKDVVHNTHTKLNKIAKQLATEQQTLLNDLNTQKQKLSQIGNTKAVAEQDTLIAQIQTRYQTLQTLLKDVKVANDTKSQYHALNALNQQLDNWQPKKSQTDMAHLPWTMPNNQVRKPIVNQSNAIQPVNFSTNLNSTNPNTARSAIHKWQDTEYRIGQYLLNKTHHNNSLAISTATSSISQMGQWTVLNALPTQVQPADLGETDDIQITDAIKTKAKQLDNNPAKIYKWVHDNIEFMPTYGSIQGSDYTLQTLRGNATDTASLLIALLRASGIPARYVYGTVDIDAKQAMDWVGGVNSIDAAQNLLGQGGIPNQALMDGAKAKYLRLEHTWVEANVSNLPAKGSIANTKNNQNNAYQNNAYQNNTWIPLDASYKSYLRTQGIDIAKAVPFDTQKLINQAKSTAIIDETTGSVKNLNQNAVNTAIANYQQQVENYLKQNYPNATIGDVLGTSQIKEYKSQFLSPVLPYQVKTVISDYQTLPDEMRHYFVMNLYQDIYERNNTIALGEKPSFHVKIPTTKLQGKPLALSFKPASKADEDIIMGMMPKPDKNGNIDSSKLPSYLPRSINMAAEITLDGQTLSQGNTYPFGTEVNLQLGYQTASMGGKGSYQMTAPLKNKIVRAGEYVAIGYNLQGISQQQLEKTKTTLENAKTQLEKFQATKDQVVLQGLTKHDLTGAILQAGVQSYFAINQAQDTIAAKQHGNVIKQPFMSYGSFATYIHPNQRYGIIFGGSPKGMQMDIDQLMYTAVSKDNNKDELKAFIQSQGVRQSANEHLIPEQLFDDPNTKQKEAEGISAVKALQIAQEQGQIIYTITKDNYAKILPKLNHGQDVMNDIRNAVNAGHIVTAHERNISVKGWHGSGYIILDPYTGAGAYLIDGGVNGGWVNQDASLMLSTIALTHAEVANLDLSKPNGLYFYYKSLLHPKTLDKLTKFLGWVSYFITMEIILNNDSLDNNKKLFQLSTTTFTFFTTMYFTNAILGFVALGSITLASGILLSLVVAFGLAIGTTYINSVYRASSYYRIFSNNYKSYEA